MVWFSCLVTLCVITAEYNVQVNGYCFGAGRNPGFTGPPKVEQINLSTVRVSWHNKVKMRDCADNFIIKFWPKFAPDNYKTTDIIDVSLDYGDVTVKPKVPYMFQAVAREDKGRILGVDYNRSPQVEFRTATGNGNKSPVSPDPGSTSSGKEEEKTGNVSPPDIYEVKEPITIAGMAIEWFVLIIVICVIAILVLFGLCYVIIKARRNMNAIKDVDNDSDYESEESSSDEEERA